MYHFKEMANQL